MQDDSRPSWRRAAADTENQRKAHSLSPKRSDLIDAANARANSQRRQANNANYGGHMDRQDVARASGAQGNRTTRYQMDGGEFNARGYAENGNFRRQQNEIHGNNSRNNSTSSPAVPPTPCRFCGEWHFNNDCPRNPYRQGNSRRAGESTQRSPNVAQPNQASTAAVRRPAPLHRIEEEIEPVEQH